MKAKDCFSLLRDYLVNLFYRGLIVKDVEGNEMSQIGPVFPKIGTEIIVIVGNTEKGIGVYTINIGVEKDSISGNGKGCPFYIIGAFGNRKKAVRQGYSSSI